MSRSFESSPRVFEHFLGDVEGGSRLKLFDDGFKIEKAAEACFFQDRESAHHFEATSDGDFIALTFVDEDEIGIEFEGEQDGFRLARPEFQ